jgi:hypothetical protein
LATPRLLQGQLQQKPLGGFADVEALAVRAQFTGMSAAPFSLKSTKFQDLLNKTKRTVKEIIQTLIDDNIPPYDG